VPRATVHMPNGDVFEGEVTLDGGAVSVEGCLRSRRWIGGEETIAYGKPVARTYPLVRTAAIHWATEEAE
jgi:hypothetical protein